MFDMDVRYALACRGVTQEDSTDRTRQAKAYRTLAKAYRTSTAEAIAVNAVPFNFVADDSLCRIKQLRRPFAISPGCL